MTEYATKNHLAKIFGKSERTIQRWIDEGRNIRRGEREFIPEQDPGRCWRFQIRRKAEKDMTTNDKV